MPEYLAPAVFVEETSFRAKSIEGVGTSTAAFVGMTARGPVSIKPDDPTPPLLTNFADFERYYGSVEPLNVGSKRPNYLALAARSFFENGGGRLYVSRIPGTGAKAAGPENAGIDAKVKFVARQEGGTTIPGTDVNYRIEIAQIELETTNALARRQPVGTAVIVGNSWKIVGTDNISNNDTTVKIVTIAVTVHGPEGILFEAAGLGLDPSHSRYIGSVLATDPPDATASLTNPVAIQVTGKIPAKDLSAALLHKGDSDAGTRTLDLTGGVDGTGAPKGDDYKEALQTLLALEDISIVACPDSQTFDAALGEAVNADLIGHAESRRAYRIAVLDTPNKLDLAGVRKLKGKIDSKYAALYYPWVSMANPMAGIDPREPSRIDLPPSGAVCGIYARNDVNRGVWKAPANETVTGALGLQRDIRFGEQEVLNPLGINCIRGLPNRGIRVWGARTLSSDPEWKYVNVRRYFLYLENSIDRGTQWAVFEPNGEALWANVTTTVTDFLYNEWMSGALLGTKPEEAFFVRCDRSTMTQNDLDNGRLICLVGVAAIKPAEFVIFRIGQKTADARG
ncbi:MAG: phage tail sheath subtilisin-like domain-containing protein [Pseudomonadota bacterium]